MRPISELLTKNRASAIWRLSPDTRVFDALKQLAEHNIGAMMVMDENRLVGVFSERDYTRKIALQGRSSKETLVREIMTVDVISVPPQTDTKTCMALMKQKNIRHLPVVDADRVLGLISMRDIMNDIIADHEETINHLTHYIAS